MPKFLDDIIISGGAKLKAENASGTVHELAVTGNNTRSTLSLKSKDSSGNSVDLRMHSLEGGRGEIFTFTNHALGFATNNAAPQMLLNTSGQLGIGTTTPIADFQVGSITATEMSQVIGKARIVGTDYAPSSTQMGTLDIASTTRSSSSPFNVNKGPSLSFSQNISGYVDGYEVVLGAIKTISRQTGNTGQEAAMTFLVNGGTSTGVVERMRIEENGSVGVGTASPDASLHVASVTNDYVAKFSHTTATGYAPGSILLQAGQNASRGQGLFHYNTEADDSWFTGVPYNVSSTKWIVAHKPDTTFNPDVAQTSHAILTIDSSNDSSTFAGDVVLSQGSYYFKNASAGTQRHGFVADGQYAFENVDLRIQATQKLYLDGGSNTYIHEASADTVSIVRGGITSLTVNSAGISSANNVYSGTSSSFRNYSGTWQASTGLTGNGFTFVNSVDGTALTLSSTGNATFGGNVTAGSNSLTAGSLDINGSADISGDLTVHGKITQAGVVDYEKYGRTYTVNTNAPLPLLTSDGSALPTGGGYRVTGHISGTGTEQVAMAVFWNENGTWNINKTFEGGVSSNHVEFKLLDHGSGSVPTVTLESHASNYNVHVYHERLALEEGSGNDNLRGYFGSDSYLSWLESTNTLTVPGSALFTGDARFNQRVRIGDVTGLSNRGAVRIDTRGDAPADLLFGRDTAGTATSWNGVYWSLSSRGSSEGNAFKIYRGVGHSSPYNSEAVPFTINPDLSATFASTINSGNITVGDASTETESRFYHSDGDYVNIHGYGLGMSRSNSYIRPISDGSQTLYIGTSSKTWNYFSVDANNVQFQKDGSTLLNLSSSALTIADSILGKGSIEEWVGSRGENLFSNGNGLLGNIVNMPGFTFDGSHANNSPGSFKWTGTGTPFTSEFIPVDTGRKYKMQYDAKTENGVGRYYGFTACFDVDGNSINAAHHMYRANTLTTLAVDLVNGATTMTLTNSANWNNAGTAGQSTHLRSLIIWNYTNSFGYTYPEETYSRNWYNNFWDPGDINFTTHVVTLRVAWTGGTVAAGTKVSNGSSGGTFKYNIMANKVLTTDWVRQSGYMDGVDYSGTNVSTKFPPGTAKVKLGWLMNYQNAQEGEVAWFTNIQVNVAASEDNEVRDAVERATDSNTFTDADHTALASTVTTANAALPKAGGTMTGDIILNDNVEVEFGTGSDVKMKFDGSDLVTTVPTNSSFLIGTNGGTPHDNSGNADFVVDVNSSPQISLYSNQVQVGGTNMNWNAKLLYDGSTKLGAWDNDIQIFTQGSGSNTAKNIFIRPQAAGGTTTTVATFNGDTGTALQKEATISHIVDGDFTALRLMNQKSYGAGTGTNEKVRFAMGVSESGVAFSDREGFVTEVSVQDETDSSNVNVEFKVRDGGTLGTYQTVTGSSKAVTFAGNIVMATNATVDGRDISGIPSSFAPVNADATNSTNVVSALNGNLGTVTFGDANDEINIQGNLTVTGITTMSGGTVINTTTNTAIKDTTIFLNSGQSSSTANVADIGLILDRGSTGNVFMGWDESEDEFIFAKTSSEGDFDAGAAVGGGTPGIVIDDEENDFLHVKVGTLESVGAITSGSSTVLTAGTAASSFPSGLQNSNVTSVSGNAGSVTNGVYTTGDQSIAGNKTFSGVTSLDGCIVYSMQAGSLDTTGFACAGLSAFAGGNGASALFTFECGGSTGNSYQRIVYACYNNAGVWNFSKCVDEGGNKFDVVAAANNTNAGNTITFTFKARSATQYYTPRVMVKAMGSSIVKTYT